MPAPCSRVAGPRRSRAAVAPSQTSTAPTSSRWSTPARSRSGSRAPAVSHAVRRARATTPVTTEEARYGVHPSPRCLRGRVRSVAATTARSPVAAASPWSRSTGLPWAQPGVHGVSPCTTAMAPNQPTSSAPPAARGPPWCPPRCRRRPTEKAMTSRPKRTRLAFWTNGAGASVPPRSLRFCVRWLYSGHDRLASTTPAASTTGASTPASRRLDCPGRWAGSEATGMSLLPRRGRRDLRANRRRTPAAALRRPREP